MSVADQVARIKGEKSKLGIKLSTMGLAAQTDNLGTLVDAVVDMPDKGAVTATVRQGESYTIPRGYHNGSGTVTGLDNPEADASKYMLQAKPVTPTKTQQSVTPDQGYYGLSSVTVARIPDAYQDVTQVNATAADVLSPKKFVKADGTVVVGEIPSINGGSTFTPIKANVPSVLVEGGTYVKGDIAVDPIPDKYQDVSGVTATAADVLTNKKIVLPDGTSVDGQIPIIDEQQIILGYEGNGEWTEFHQIEKGYHNGESTIFIVRDVKEATPNKTTQVILPTPSRVLEKVTVNPIPDAYQDVTGVTATADTVLDGSIFVAPDGTPTEGNIPTIPDFETRLYSGSLVRYANIAKGYHSGNSKFTWEFENNLTVTPKKEQQVKLADASKMGFVNVTVEPIPSTFLDTTDTANHKGNNNLTASDATVTVEAGYYPSGASKSVKNVGKVEIVADPLVVDDQSGVMRNLQINAFVTEIDVLLDPSLEEELATI